MPILTHTIITKNINYISLRLFLSWYISGYNVLTNFIIPRHQKNSIVRLISCELFPMSNILYLWLIVIICMRASFVKMYLLPFLTIPYYIPLPLLNLGAMEL